MGKPDINKKLSCLKELIFFKFKSSEGEFLKFRESEIGGNKKNGLYMYMYYKLRSRYI
jgi:hypothetical protein